MRKIMYLKSQVKRAVKLYPSVLLITLITIISIALTAGVLISDSLNSTEKKKLKIGIVGDTSESYLGVGITALKEIDSSRYALEFIETDEETAAQGVRNLEFSGYIHMPDNFIKGIWKGWNIPAEYVVLNDTTGFETIIVSEIADIVSEWVIRAQGSVYGLHSLIYDCAPNGQIPRLEEHIMNMNLMYIDNVLNRTNTYEKEIMGIADAISMEGYYICGIIMFFLLIWGISCNKLLIKKNAVMPRFLYARGIKTSWQIFSEYSGFFLITFITLFILSIAFGAVISNNDFGIAELESADWMSCVAFVFKIIPVIVMMTAMQMMLYELVYGTVNAISLQFFVAVALAYISGCFYPNSFFPEEVQKFAAVLPSGVGFSYMRKSMTGISVMSDLGIIALYTAAFASMTIFIRKRSMAGDKQ